MSKEKIEYSQPVADKAILISLISTLPGYEKLTVDKTTRILGRYKKSLYNLCRFAYSDDEKITSNDIDNYFKHLYSPRFYVMWGKFDIAAISLIDDFEIIPRMGSFKNVVTHQTIFGPLEYHVPGKPDQNDFEKLVADKDKELYEFFIPRNLNFPQTKEKKIFEWDIEKEKMLNKEERKKEALIVITQLKVNHIHSMVFGKLIIDMVKNFIYKHYLTEYSAGSNKQKFSDKLKLFVFNSYGWSDLTVITTSNSYNLIMDFLYGISEMTYKDLEDFCGGEHSYLATYFKNIKGDKQYDLYNTFIQDDKDYKQSHVFVTVNHMAGYSYDFFSTFKYQKNKEEKINYMPIESSEEVIKKINDSIDGSILPWTHFKSRPGHLTNLTENDFNNPAPSNHKNNKDRQNIVCNLSKFSSTIVWNGIAPYYYENCSVNDDNNCNSCKSFTKCEIKPIFTKTGKFINLFEKNKNEIFKSEDNNGQKRHHLHESQTDILIPLDIEHNRIKNNPYNEKEHPFFYNNLSVKDDVELGYLRENVEKIYSAALNLHAPNSVAITLLNIYNTFFAMMRDIGVMDTFLELYPYLKNLYYFLGNEVKKDNNYKKLYFYYNTLKGEDKKDFEKEIEGSKYYKKDSLPKCREVSEQFEKDTKKNISRLIDLIPILKSTFSARFNATDRMSEITDLGYEYKGSVLEIFSAIDGTLKGIMEDLHLKHADRAGNSGANLDLSYLNGFAYIEAKSSILCRNLFGTVVQLNLFHLLQPENLIQLVHECCHPFLQNNTAFSSFNEFIKKRTKDISYKYYENDEKQEEKKKKAEQSEDMVSEFLYDVVCDYFWYKTSFARFKSNADNLEMFNKHFWMFYERTNTFRQSYIFGTPEIKKLNIEIFLMIFKNILINILAGENINKTDSLIKDTEYRIKYEYIKDFIEKYYKYSSIFTTIRDEINGDNKKAIEQLETKFSSVIKALRKPKDDAPEDEFFELILNIKKEIDNKFSHEKDIPFKDITKMNYFYPLTESESAFDFSNSIILSLLKYVTEKVENRLIILSPFEKEDNGKIDDIKYNINLKKTSFDADMMIDPRGRFFALKPDIRKEIFQLRNGLIQSLGDMSLKKKGALLVDYYENFFKKFISEKDKSTKL